MLSSNLLSRLTPHAEEIIVDHQCGFCCIRSTTDHIFCISQILEKKWEYNEAVHQLFIEFKKPYDSVRVEVLCNTLIDFGTPIKLSKAHKKCLNKTFSRVQVGKYSSDIQVRTAPTNVHFYYHIIVEMCICWFVKTCKSFPMHGTNNVKFMCHVSS